MSWQAYVDNNLVGTKLVTKAGIFGQDGSVWATSPGFPVNAKEVKEIVGGFKDASNLRAHGIHAATEKYFTLKADDRSIYGKKGAGGIVCVRTGKAVLLGTYDDKIQPGQCANVVEKLADYLIENGF